ncbi:hypothetical protein BDZ45DRAFT_731215 [Acephala macrosclerotiorum]|nr:hypothetical protein BDZ45DRAFT_731215 [Acephala macrosclerotiorum]
MAPTISWAQVKKQNFKWLEKSRISKSELPVAFAQEILRRCDPTSPLLIACKIEDKSDLLENETELTAAWHCPNGSFDDRMEPSIASILSAREDETYRPIPRNYFTFLGAMASSLGDCLLYERRETWTLIQSHPLFATLPVSRAKAKCVEFFNIRYSSLFADITGSYITLDPAGVTGSSTYLRLPDELPTFDSVAKEFGGFKLPRGPKKWEEEEGKKRRLGWGKFTDNMCLRWSKGSEESLFVLNAWFWGRLLWAADPEQEAMEEFVALLKEAIPASEVEDVSGEDGDADVEMEG